MSKKVVARMVIYSPFNNSKLIKTYETNSFRKALQYATQLADEYNTYIDVKYMQQEQRVFPKALRKRGY